MLQMLVIIIAPWMLFFTMLLIWGGRHKRDFKTLAFSGLLLIVIGCASALAIIIVFPDAVWNMLLVNLFLVSSGAAGANYLSHAFLNQEE